jgi:hypothetical protein
MSVPPPPSADPTESSIANDGRPPYDENMKTRIEKLESDIAAIKIDLGILKANSATKSDIAETKALISEAKSSIIIWVAAAIVLAQLLPAILKLFIKN